ncbi:hypothetical protein B7494_g2034 [Chlorociboria aeruginascens]|nr:hypothetical protein B7494_g2034 [Chlorociboria aeruginascens]
MAYRSPSTPRTLLQVQIVDTSISRARHLLEGWGDILEIKQVQRQISRFTLSSLLTVTHSGPVGSDQYKHPWLFDAYMPEVMVRFIQVIPNYQTDFVKVMNIGNSDWESFQMYEEEYNKTSWELSTIFEDTYVSLIKAIRALAYPESLTSVDSFPYNYSPRSMPTGLPIFIMRPFRGQLEQATRSVVDRLRAEGDKSLTIITEESPSKQWRLTERGNQRVAVLLHMHVCRYLAQDVEKCAFLPPEVYQGQAIDPEATNFDDFLHDEREPKLKELFWV